MENSQEIERIKEVYRIRKEKISAHQYSYFNSPHLYIVQSRERAFLNALVKNGIASLKAMKILDVGCGTGSQLRNLVQYGAMPENCFGIDLLQDRIEIARRYLAPEINIRCGNAENLPYGNDFFDIVIQFTVFTSILDKNMEKNIAAEMLRVLKPKGIIIW
jgi:ubiquinone/menaquinone biosynthesis C-methylase UbiE